MKIAVITTSFPRFPGDYAGIFVFDMVRTLVKHGLFVRVLAPHDANVSRKAEMNGVAVTRFPYFVPVHWQRLAYGAGIPTNLRNSRMARLQLLPFVVGFLAGMRHVVPSSDLTHAHWIESGLISLPWNLVQSRPKVLSVHRFNPPGALGEIMYRWVLSNFDHVIFNSRFTEAQCQKLTTLRASSVIPPGVDTTRFKSKWSLANLRPLGNVDLAIVTTLGSLLPVKGFLHLIEAIPLVLQEMRCHFVIGGQGPERERLLLRARQLGVDDQLTLLGRVPTEQVPDLMRNADVFVLPSIPHPSGDNEALGMVVAEAMASGTPCVASNTGGISDLVDDGDTGILVTPGDPVELASGILRLLEDSDLRARMGRAGRRKIEREFALDIVARRTIAIYEDLLS